MFKKKLILVVIPARSGSKGIKNKNIKKLNKKPLISYTINYAKKCRLVDKIIVSTDSSKYAKIAMRYKAEVPFLRPKKLSGDKIKDYPVIKDCLRKCEKYYLVKYEYIVLLRPTSPFREKNLIERGIKKLYYNRNGTSVRSVIQTKCHPYRQWIINKLGQLKSIIKKVKEPYNIPRQQLPKIFFQTGDIEIIKRKTIIDGSISGSKIIPLIVNSFKDIDTKEDFKNLKNA